MTDMYDPIAEGLAPNGELIPGGFAQISNLEKCTHNGQLCVIRNGVVMRVYESAEKLYMLPESDYMRFFASDEYIRRKTPGANPTVQKILSVYVYERFIPYIDPETGTPRPLSPDEFDLFFSAVKAATDEDWELVERTLIASNRIDYQTFYERLSNALMLGDHADEYRKVYTTYMQEHEPAWSKRVFPAAWNETDPYAGVSLIEYFVGAEYVPTSERWIAAKRLKLRDLIDLGVLESEETYERLMREAEIELIRPFLNEHGLSADDPAVRIFAHPFGDVVRLIDGTGTRQASWCGGVHKDVLKAVDGDGWEDASCLPDFAEYMSANGLWQKPNDRKGG